MKVQLKGMARAASQDGKTIEGEKVLEMFLRFNNRGVDGQEIDYTNFTE